MSIVDNIFNWNEEERLSKLLGKPSDIFNAFTTPMPAIQLAAGSMGFSPNFVTPAMKQELERQIMSDIKRKGEYSGGIGYKDLGWDHTMYTDTGEHIDVSKNNYLQNSNGLFSPQWALGMTGGKMDWKADPITGKINWGGSDYNFGTNNPGAVSIDKKNVGWNPDLTIDPRLMKKEIDAFTPHERWRQGQIQRADPVEVIENSADHYKMKFQEDKVPFKTIPDPFKTVPQTTPQYTPPPTPTQRNETKFAPTRSTTIKGGRGGRGNVGRNSTKAGSSRNYGVTGKRVVGGR